MHARQEYLPAEAIQATSDSGESRRTQVVPKHFTIAKTTWHAPPHCVGSAPLRYAFTSLRVKMASPSCTSKVIQGSVSKLRGNIEQLFGGSQGVVGEEMCTG